MPAPPGKVPILASVQAGLGFVRDNARTVLPVLASGAAALTIAPLLGVAIGGRTMSGALMALLAQNLISVGLYAWFLRKALGADGPFLRDAGNLLTTMIVIGFFLLIVFGMALIPGMIAFGATLAPYEAEMAAAQGDPAALNALAERVTRENPAPALVLIVTYLAIWMALSSRVYLAAPATIAEGRVRTFETWAWTNGAMLRISAARLVLIVTPLITLLTLQGAALGVLQAQDPPNALMTAIVAFALALGSCAVLALEAGLSAFLYRGLKPAS
jgi:hypothetical protein